jgi:lysophospholipase L1-like esterase
MLPYRLRMRRALLRPASSGAAGAGGAVRAVATAAVLAVTLTACSSGGAGREPDPDVSDVGDRGEVSEPDRYVALGDSYTAAPLRPIPERAQGCMRSKRNYPRLVAAELENTELVDVSCSGASTISIFHEQGFDTTDAIRPPQLDAVTSDTDLVTVSIGANDFRFFNSMIYECLEIAKTDPDGAPCREFNTRGKRDRLERTLEKIAPRVSNVVETILERAPGVRVLLVGYPQLLPDEGRCPQRLPLAVEDYAYALSINQRLAESIRDAAVSAGAEYVDLFDASKGHDICSEEPWIAGVRGAQRAMGFHPYPTEQRAVADLVLEQLESD